MFTWGPSSGGVVVESSAWNAADKNVDVSLSNSDFTASLTAPLSGMVRGVQSRDASENRYFEVTMSGASDGRSLVGVVTADQILNSYPGNSIYGWSYFGNTGESYTNGTPTAYGDAWGNDVIGVWLNAGTVTFYKNGVSQGVAYSGLSGTMFPGWGSTTASAGTRSATIRTAPPFSYLPSGAGAWG